MSTKKVLILYDMVTVHKAENVYELTSWSTVYYKFIIVEYFSQGHPPSYRSVPVTRYPAKVTVEVETHFLGI